MVNYFQNVGRQLLGVPSILKDPYGGITWFLLILRLALSQGWFTSRAGRLLTSGKRQQHSMNNDTRIYYFNDAQD